MSHLRKANVKYFPTDLVTYRAVVQTKMSLPPSQGSDRDYVTVEGDDHRELLTFKETASSCKILLQSAWQSSQNLPISPSAERKGVGRGC